MPKHTKRKIAEYINVIEQFNRKIDRVTSLGIRNQPDKIDTEKAVERADQLTTKQLNNIMRRYRRYLEPGAEELVNIKSGGVTTRWLKKETDTMIDSINKSRAYRRTKGFGIDETGQPVKPPDKQDAIYYKKENRLQNLRGREQINRYFEQLSRSWEVETDRIQTYKTNYLKAVEENFGKGELWLTVNNMNANTLTALYYKEPELLRINYVYVGDPSQAQDAENRILEAFRDESVGTRYQQDVSTANRRARREMLDALE